MWVVGIRRMLALLSKRSADDIASQCLGSEQCENYWYTLHKQWKCTILKSNCILVSNGWSRLKINALLIINSVAIWFEAILMAFCAHRNVVQLDASDFLFCSKMCATSAIEKELAPAFVSSAHGCFVMLTEKSVARSMTLDSFDFKDVSNVSI